MVPHRGGTARCGLAHARESTSTAHNRTVTADLAMHRAATARDEEANNSQRKLPWQQNLHRFSYLAVIAYDGTEYNGYQAQTGDAKRSKTVHAAVLHALCVRLQASPESLKLVVRVFWS